MAKGEPHNQPCASWHVPAALSQTTPGNDGSVGWSPAADTVALLREEGCLDTGMNVMIQMT